MDDAVEDSGDGVTRKNLPRGDYRVSVKIIEARDLSGINSGGLASPMVEVTVMGQSHRTATFKGVLNCRFDEILGFEFAKQEPEQINRGKIEIKVFDTSSLLGNNLIGATELDLTSIYFRDNFELYHQWLALSDTTDSREGVQGYLKVDIHVLHEDDEYNYHEEGDSDGGADELLNILNPPNIDVQSKSLAVHIHRLEKLPIMDDFGGTCDPFVRIEFAGNSQDTTHFKNTLSVDIDEQLIIPVLEPCRTRNIMISVWDSDFTSNELIATWSYDYNDLRSYMDPEKLKALQDEVNKLEKQVERADDKEVQDANIDDPFESEQQRKEKERSRQQKLIAERNQLQADLEANKVSTPARYVHLYGAPLHAYKTTREDSAFMKMNRGYIEGSTYRGTMLLHFSLEEEEDGIAGKEDSPWQNDMNPDLVKYGLQCDVYQGAEITNRNGKFKKFQVKMSICQMTISTKPAVMDPESGLIEWTEIMKNDDGQETIEFMFPKAHEQCPDICFYVYADDQLLSYTRLTFKELLENPDSWNARPKWVHLKKERAANQLLEDELPGMVLLGLRMGLLKDKPDNIAEMCRPFVGTESKKSLFGEDNLNIPKNLRGNLMLEICELVDYPKAAGGYINKSKPAIQFTFEIIGERIGTEGEDVENTGLTAVIFHNYDELIKRDILCPLCLIHEDLIDIMIVDKTEDDNKPQELWVTVTLWPESTDDYKRSALPVRSKKFERQLREKFRKKGRTKELTQSKLLRVKDVKANDKDPNMLVKKIWKADPFIWVKCGRKTHKLPCHELAEYPARKSDRHKNGFVWDEVVTFRDVHVDQTVEIIVYEKDRLRSPLIGNARFKVLSLSEQPLGTDFTNVTKRLFLKTSKNMDKREMNRLEKLREKERERMSAGGEGYVDEEYLDELIEAEESYCKIIVKATFEHNESLAIENDVPRVGLTNPNPTLFNTNTNESDKTNLAQLGRPQLVQQRMVCYIYQARDLEGKDDNGMSDPYVVVRYAGDSIKTEVKKKNLNPQWMERKHILISIPRQHEYAPDIQVTVYDSDADEIISWSDDVLGRFSIPYEEAMEMTQPEWFDLKDERGDICGGKVYMFLEFQDPLEGDTDYAFQIKPKKEKYWMHIFTLGVRHLQGGAFIKKARVTYYDSEGNKYPDGDQQELTSSEPTAHNANFRNNQSVPILIAKNPELAPSWAIYVDNIMWGNIPKLVGTATVNLRDYMALTPSGGWEPKITNNEILIEKNLQNEIYEEEIAEDDTEMSVRLRAEFLAKERAEMWSDAWLLNKDLNIEPRWKAAQQKADDFWNKLYSHEKDISLGKVAPESPYKVPTEFSGYGKAQNRIIQQLKADYKRKIKDLGGEAHDSDEEDDLDAAPVKKKKLFDASADTRLTVSGTEASKELEREHQRVLEKQKKAEKDLNRARHKREEQKRNQAAFSKLEDLDDEESFDAMGDQMEIGGDTTRLTDKQSQAVIDGIAKSASPRDKAMQEELKKSASKLLIVDKNKDGVESYKEKRDVEEIKSDAALLLNENVSKEERAEALARIETKLETPETMKRNAEIQAAFEEDDSDSGAALLEQEIETKEQEVTLSRRQRKKLERERRRKLKESTNAWLTTSGDNEFDMSARVNKDSLQMALPYLQDRKKLSRGTLLEEYYDCHPFQNFPLWTGQKGGSTFFGTNRRQVGQVKGLWKISKNKEEGFKDELKQLLEPRGLVVQIYILQAILEVAMDADNANDPYVVVKLGEQQYSSRTRYLENTMRPRFHEAFEFKTRLPGPSQLIIEVWDWDGIGDDLVGICEIDIEDRWFSKSWRKIKPPRPTEWKPLKNPKSKQAFGHLQFWLDMWTMNEARTNPIEEIALPPIEKWELRIVVWDAKNCAIKDEITNMNDLFITIQPNLPKNLKNPKSRVTKMSTDTHMRAKGGRGSFRWRCKWDLELGEQLFLSDNPITITFSAFDLDIFSSNDLIGEYHADFTNFFLYAFRAKDRVTLTQKRRHWMTQQMISSKKLEFKEFYHPNEKEDGILVSQATVYFTIELMPKRVADDLPAGQGRGDPNAHPYLPERVGRFEWSLNPISVLRQILGDALCFQICSCVFGVLCVAMLVMTGPMIVTNFIVSMLG